MPLVPRAGFEPATLTLEPSCSNPLSYQGMLILSGAGGENRTRILCLEGRYISHYTTPAWVSYVAIITEAVLFYERSCSAA